MNVGELKAKLSEFADETPVVCFEGESHDDAVVESGVLRGRDEFLHYGAGAMEDAVDACESQLDKLTKVCVIKPAFV